MTFQVESRNSSRGLVLESYLAEDSARAKNLIPGSRANADIEIFQNSLKNLSERLEEFLRNNEYQKAILVLGKIQSGKTSHLLGTLAWCADSKFGIATIFTGITGELNTQTSKRLNESLLALGTDFISIHEVPTSSDSQEYKNLFDLLRAQIQSRINSKKPSPLPILVTMKNKYRLKTLEVLFKDLHEEFGSELKALIIDDEADQASQNSKASSKKSTTTYDSIVKVRAAGLPNFLLSYTATPQAVLLTEKLGKLRPNECVVAPPRFGYFGLQDCFESSYSENLIEVDDWPAGKGKISTCPESLKAAMLDFFLTTYVRNQYPKIFFEESRLSNIDHYDSNKSLQMMIHEAVEVEKHKDVFRLVQNEKNDLIDNLTSYLNGDLVKSVHGDFLSSIFGAWKKFTLRLPIELSKQISFNESNLEVLLDVVKDSEIVVVNASKNRPNIEVKFPTSKEEWNQHKAWILVGGDILGRGLTIPQLVTTYFLRSSKRPNFDTVSQQMRFCGYRSAYKSFTSIWAPEATFLTFEYMNKVETVMWNRVSGWDQERLDLSKEFPRVIYAAPLDINMEPTRKSVRDPDLLDKKIKGEIIFTSRKVMDPNRVAENLNLIKRWSRTATQFNKLGTDWLHIDEPDNDSIQNLLKRWKVSSSEKNELNAATELFEDDLADLGLAFMPKSFFISKDVLTADMGSLVEINKTLNKSKFFRTILNPPNSATFDTWGKGFIEELPENNVFSDISITHVGGSQRRLRKHIPYDAVIFVIEFVRGTNSDSSTKGTISLGLCLSILSPAGYEIRTLGYK